MCKMVLKAKFYVTGSLDTAPCRLDTALCSGASNENLQKVDTGACWLGTTPCLAKICRIVQTADLGQWARGRVGWTRPRVDSLQG